MELSKSFVVLDNLSSFIKGNMVNEKMIVNQSHEKKTCRALINKRYHNSLITNNVPYTLTVI